MQRAVWGSDFSRLSPDSTAVERLLKMEPKVECTGDSMQLQVSNAASTPGSLFFVDRGKFPVESYMYYHHERSIMRGWGEKKAITLLV